MKRATLSETRENCPLHSLNFLPFNPGIYSVADLATNHIQCDTMHTVIGVLIMEVDMVGFAVETYGSLDILVNNSQSWGTRDQPTGQTLDVDGGSFLHT